MKTVQINWRKVIPALLTIVVLILVLARSFTSSISTAKRDVRSKFRKDGKLGNYEVFEEPKHGPGENGEGHNLKSHQRQQEERLKSVYGFNQLVSDEISLDRTVPDIREKECKHWDYPENLPTASVVFIFHNEGWSTLMRSVHSVINRTPSKLLHEIVLVDDQSELEHLHERLEDEIKKPYYQGKVKLVRNKEREGLIRSRNNGAIAASGDVVVFLDAHCEVGPNWLPPLLAPIAEDPTTLSVPVIDGIEWNDFSIRPVYSEGQHSRGIFEWGMLYKEGPLPEKEAAKRKYHSEPYNAPTHAGGLFAIKRSWFKQLGWYDPGLQIWGGENYELAFKLWQCGGRSVWVPCSRIGHVYRGHGCSSCHSGGVTDKWNGVPLALRNYKRLVETWFDDKYKEYFYTREPLARLIDMGDISEQLALKKKLNCKSFSWFMKEIAYDVLNKYPELPPNAFWGELRNKKTDECLDSHGQAPPSLVSTSPCHRSGGSQLIRLNIQGQLASGEWCMEYSSDMGLHMVWCDKGVADGPWSYDEKIGFVHNFKYKDKCLSIDSESKLLLEQCSLKNKHQIWKFKEVKPYWVDRQPHSN